MRERGQEVDLFDFGQVIRWTPEFHVSLSNPTWFFCLSNSGHKFLEDLKGFQNFYDFVKQSYINGRPRQVDSPDQSFIATFSYTQYLEMSVAKVQSILRDKHILITGMPTQSIFFDSKGLQTLTNLDARIDIQGMLVCL